MTVFFISPYLTNIMFLITIYVSGFQHVQMKRPNPVTNIQFFLMVFGMVMIIVVALYNSVNPWLSLAFFLAGAASLATAIRQLLMMPPMKPIE